MMFKKRTRPITQPRQEHCISRRNIDPAALQVLYGLSRAGYAAYLVGGSVRDLLIGRHPKDFDVSTDAHPNDIRRVFRRNCFLIGRRFRLAHIRFGDAIIETSTFRRPPDPAKIQQPAPDSLYQRFDNTFGTPEEDALRRDFTINGLFYDIQSFSVIDYVGGLKDLERRRIRSIGDPNIRFREDPVRMLRAIRFSARLGFAIDRGDLRAIRRHAHEILHASPPRLFEEILRLFMFQSAEHAFQLLWETGLMTPLLPEISDYIDHSGKAMSPLWRYLKALDQPYREMESGPAVCFCALFLPLLLERIDETLREQQPIIPERLFHELIDPISARLPFPKALTAKMRYLFLAQRDLTSSPAPRRRRDTSHPDFGDALMLHRIQCLAKDQDVTEIENRMEKTDSAGADDPSRAQPSRPRRRRGRRRRSSDDTAKNHPDPSTRNVQEPRESL